MSIVKLLLQMVKLSGISQLHRFMEFCNVLAGFAVDYSLFIINYCIVEKWWRSAGDATSEFSCSNHDVGKVSQQPFLSFRRTRQ